MILSKKLVDDESLQKNGIGTKLRSGVIIICTRPSCYNRAHPQFMKHALGLVVITIQRLVTFDPITFTTTTGILEHQNNHIFINKGHIRV